jgi:hypothetical protein
MVAGSPDDGDDSGTQASIDLRHHVGAGVGKHTPQIKGAPKVVTHQ